MAASRVKSGLILSSKCQNNCSNISRWTLSEDAQLYLILHQSCFSFKSDHQDLYFHWMIFITSSEECLFLHLSISIALYVWILHISSYWDIIGDIEQPLIFMYIILCQYLYCYKGLIDWYCNQSFIHFGHIKYQHLHQTAYFFLLSLSLGIKLSCFSSIFSLYQTI